MLRIYRCIVWIWPNVITLHYICNLMLISDPAFCNNLPFLLFYDVLPGLHVYVYNSRAGLDAKIVNFVAFTPVRTSCTTCWACMTISMVCFLCWNIIICILIWAGMCCMPTGWNLILNIPFPVIESLHACWVSHIHTCSSRHKLTNEMGKCYKFVDFWNG